MTINVLDPGERFEGVTRLLLTIAALAIVLPIALILGLFVVSVSRAFGVPVVPQHKSGSNR